MKLHLTLSRYIAWQFFAAVMVVLVSLLSVTSLLDLLELARRSAKYDAPFSAVLKLVALKLPYMLEQMVPYAVLIGSMAALVRLTRSQELVVARAAGVSVWQFLSPAIAVVMGIGVFMTTLFNPFSATMFLRFEQVEARYFSGGGSLLVVSSSGLWMRQMEDSRESPASEHIIKAARISPHEGRLEKLIIFSFDKHKNFYERLDAASAILVPGTLTLSGVMRSRPGKPPEMIAEFALPTSLTMEYIQDSFASPETMSFWRLPGFIGMLEDAGFSAMRHRLYYQSLLARPFLLAGMVWVAAVFSLRQPRRGRIGLLITGGLLTGFLLYFFTDLVHALGSAGTVPVLLAAWAPALVMLMTGAALLLHIEDG